MNKFDLVGFDFKTNDEETTMITLDDALKLETIEHAIRDTGTNMSERYRTGTQELKPFIDMFEKDQDVWLFSTSYINDLPRLIPFFKEKEFSILVQLDSSNYQTYVHHEYYCDEGTWEMRDSGRQRQMEDIKLVIGLGFKKICGVSYMLGTNE
jgi:hypothetical protein